MPILQKVIQLARSNAARVNKSDKKAIAELCSAIDLVTTNDFDLPPADASRSPAVYYGNVWSDAADSLHASVFGFYGIGAEIPLHDHPNMHGFIKCLRGSILVTSFSRVAEIRESRTRLKFENTRVIKPKDGVVTLTPDIGNQHQIRALELGTCFFDILIPGYSSVNPCHYYCLLDAEPISGHKEGDVLEAEVSDSPTGYYSDCIHVIPPKARRFI